MIYWHKPRFKLYRRECIDLLLKSRFSIKKFDIKKKIIFKNFNKLSTHFCYQLKEKRKLKILYGILEKQFNKYYFLSKKKKGDVCSNIFNILESRLDNVVYRMGFATTRAEARQIVNHKCILVNNNLINLPSFLTKVGDVVEVKNACRYQKRIIDSLNFYKNFVIPNWVFIDFINFKGYLKRLPLKNELQINIDENLIFNSHF